MKGMGGLNHKNKQIPTSYTNNIHSLVSDSKYQGVAAYLWPVATVAGAELQYIYIKKICYEYEVGEVPQTYPTAWQPSDSPTYADLPLADISMGLHPYDL